MQAHSKNVEQAALRRNWRHWTRIVERLARRRKCPVGSREYQALHQELLRGCRSLADGAGEADRALYQHLEDLVHPWLTALVLEQADRDILEDLLFRCRQAGQKLTGGG